MTDFGALSWLVLADAYNTEYGFYDFFRVLQNELFNKKPSTPQNFYNIIDNIFYRKINRMKAPEWLKSTALYNDIPSESVFIFPLTLNGDIRNFNSRDNPVCLIPMVVSRKNNAEIINEKYEVVIKDESGKIVFETSYTRS